MRPTTKEINMLKFIKARALEVLVYIFAVRTGRIVRDLYTAYRNRNRNRSTVTEL